VNPAKTAAAHHDSSLHITAPLAALILQQETAYPHNINEKQATIKRRLKFERRQKQAEDATRIRAELTPNLQRAMDLGSEKGASSWLMTLPIYEHNFALPKGSFRDAICLRYGWQPSRLPSHCVCGANFSVEHALSCSCGGFPSIRHNNIRDLTAKLLTEVCHNVATEPLLQPLSGERLLHRTSNSEDGARLDVCAQGFWGDRHQRAFFDVRVFNPLAPSNCRSSLTASYRHHESQKRRNYEQRVWEIEHGSFAPLVFSATGGMAPTASIVYKRLASLLADKRQQEYSKVISWIRCTISFSLV